MVGVPSAARRKGRIVQPETGWSAGQRALLRFLEQQGILKAEPAAPVAGRPTNADLFATFADAIDQRDLVDLVSRALRIASVDLAGFAPMPDLVALVPVEVARRGEVIPIAQYDGTLELAAANPLDLETVKSVEFTTGLRVRTKVAVRADVCRALGDAYGIPATPPAPAAAPLEAPAADPPEAASAPVETAQPESGDAGTVWQSAAAPEPAAWSFDATADDAGDGESADGASVTEAVDDEAEEESAIEWRAVDGDEGVPVWELPDDGTAEVDGESALATDDEPAASTDDEPALSIDDGAPDLGRFDDVRLDDPAPAATEASGARVAVAPAAAPIGRGTAPPVGRPAVVVVTRDLGRRVAVREALEGAVGAPCVLTMRDEMEARAALGLGGVAVLVVEGGALGADGRPLWEALRGRAGATVVWGGRPVASEVVSLDRDTEAAEVAARVRALLEEKA